MKKKIITYGAIISLLLVANTIGDGSKLMREVAQGKAYVKTGDGDLPSEPIYVTTVHVTIDFNNPASAYGGPVTVEKGGSSVEIMTMPDGKYARGQTRFFQGKSPIGLWKAYPARIPKQGVKIYLRIEYSTSATVQPQPTPIPQPQPQPKPKPELQPVPQPQPKPQPKPFGEIKITSEVQFQALTRILIRKGIVDPVELAEEIQKVASEK